MRRPAIRVIQQSIVLAFRIVIALCAVSLRARDLTAAPQTVTQDIFNYTMNGRVRVIFFWFGKSNVGGGHIAFTEMKDALPEAHVNDAEVLFGSDPARVPGRINRWGYGHELAAWKSDKPGGPLCLEGTLFEGFIRHSNEQSLWQVKQSDSKEKLAKLFWFDGIQSSVSVSQADTAIWQFSQTTDFDYRNILPAIQSYRKRREQGPPDRTGRLPNTDHLYAAPYGFLTAVRQILWTIDDAYLSGNANWLRSNPEMAYAYNAKIYNLRVVHVTNYAELPSDFGNSKPLGIEESALKELAETDFELDTKPPTGPRRFSILFPLRGDYRTVPIRIRDRPRWWLEVELKLTSHEHVDKAVEDSALADTSSVPRLSAPCQGAGGR